MSTAVDSFLAFINREIESFEEGEGLSPRSQYEDAVTKLTDTVETGVEWTGYIDFIFRAKHNNEDDDVIEYLEEMAGILEDLVDD